MTRDPWTLAEWETADGGLLLVRTRDRLPDEAERARYPIIIRAVWPYEADGDTELPHDDEFDRMADFENTLYRAMEEGRWAVSVAAITGGGQKEWLYYCADAEEFVRETYRALKGHPDYPFTLESGRDPGWLTLGELLPRGTPH